MMGFPAFKRTALRWLLPEICAHCREDIPAGERGPLCRRCLGLLTPDEEGLSAVLSAFLYRGPAVSLVHAFKFRGSRSAAGLAGALLASALPRLAGLELFDALVPVPLHPRRELERGYNQARILAIEISRATGLPAVDLLERVKDTKASWSLGRGQRRENLRGAFVARRKLSGGSFLVIDDVLTTGETLEGCARALLAAGARRVQGGVFVRQGLNAAAFRY